jgi:hypothetical protein
MCCHSHTACALRVCIRVGVQVLSTPVTMTRYWSNQILEYFCISLCFATYVDTHRLSDRLSIKQPTQDSIQLEQPVSKISTPDPTQIQIK